jgi:hypothetical protein
VFEDIVLRKIFGSKNDEISEKCKLLQNKELPYLYRPPAIDRIGNLGVYDWKGMNLRWERQGMHTEFWQGNLLENGQF